MPKTEQKTRRQEKKKDDTRLDVMPTRDVETQKKLDETDALLDEIDTILDEATVEVVEEQITLSSLMRAGSMRRGKAVCRWTTTQDGPACALGTAYLEARDRGLI
jgi:hypothetical protein